jgi:hypothetical protein
MAVEVRMRVAAIKVVAWRWSMVASAARRPSAVREKQAEVKLKRQERPKPSARRRRPGLPPRLRLLRTLLWGM